MNDQEWMQQALEQARMGEGHVEPNPMVGCVIVRDGVCVSRGFHQKFGGPHAEVEAVHASQFNDLQGCTVYVTLEPCCHFGKTPPCSQLLIKMRPDRVVIGVQDPFPRVAGGGIQQLREAGIQVDVGILESACRDLIAPFRKGIEQRLPWVIAKWAMSLDGKIATATGESHWISNAFSRQRVHHWRGQMDAIVVGIGTVLADDPMLTARPAGARVPLRVVFDSECRIPTTSRLVTTAREVPVLVCTTSRAPMNRILELRNLGCEVVVAESPTCELMVKEMMGALHDHGVTNVLVEGGSHLLGTFFDSGQVDEVRVFIAPIVIGGQQAPSSIAGVGIARMVDAKRYQQVKWEELDGDLLLVGR